MTSDPIPKPGEEENEAEVRRLLAGLGPGPAPSLVERQRIAAAMWRAVGGGVDAQGDRSEVPLVLLRAAGSDRSTGPGHWHGRTSARVGLWAAAVLIVGGLVSLLQVGIGQNLQPAVPAEPGRMVRIVGDTQVSFNAESGYTVETRRAASTTLMADIDNLRAHERITVGQSRELFGGGEARAFYAELGLSPESVTAEPGSTAWLVSVPAELTCAPGAMCATVAVTTAGDPINLRPATFSRIEIYDNGDRAPIVVISEVGAPTSGPALPEMELSG